MKILLPCCRICVDLSCLNGRITTRCLIASHTKFLETRDYKWNKVTPKHSKRISYIVRKWVFLCRIRNRLINWLNWCLFYVSCILPHANWEETIEGFTNKPIQKEIGFWDQDFQNSQKGVDIFLTVHHGIEFFQVTNLMHTSFIL